MKLLWQLYSAFFKIGLFTFGGGYAMLPMIEREICIKHKWADMDEIADYFAIGQCTPGVIAVNTATFIGYKKKRISGGIFATLGVITPSIIIISALAGIIDVFSENIYVQRAFAGISVAVCALMVQSLIKLAKSGVKDIFGGIIAVFAFILSLVFGINSIFIIIGAGIAGCIYKVLIESKKADKEGTK